VPEKKCLCKEMSCYCIRTQTCKQRSVSLGWGLFFFSFFLSFFHAVLLQDKVQVDALVLYFYVGGCGRNYGGMGARVRRGWGRRTKSENDGDDTIAQPRGVTDSSVECVSFGGRSHAQVFSPTLPFQSYQAPVTASPFFFFSFDAPRLYRMGQHVNFQGGCRLSGFLNAPSFQH